MNLSIRDLFEKIWEYEGKALYQDILSPWPIKNDYKKYMEKVSESLSKNNPVETEDSWELYALSRVLDLLTLKFQTNDNTDKDNRFSPELTLKEYADFASLLGLSVHNSKKYVPFYCEIIEAVEGVEDFMILENLYPSLMLGKLLIKKGGAVISLNPQKFNLDVVNNSTIYWTYRRVNRKYEDLSQGWGSNSQWRTKFRFDFDYGDNFVYNSEGKMDLNTPTDKTLSWIKEDNLTLEEAIELTVNRHFITVEKQSHDLCPYDYRYSEPNTRGT